MKAELNHILWVFYFVSFYFLLSLSLRIIYMLPTCLAVSFFSFPLVYFLVTQYIYYNYSYTSVFMLPFFIDDRDHSILLYLVSLSSKRWLCVKFFTIIFAHAIRSKRKFSFKFNSFIFSYNKKKSNAEMRPKGGLYYGGRHIFCLLLPKTNKN